MSTNTKLAEALRKGRGLLPDASLMSDDELAWDLEAAAVLAEFDAAKGEAMNNDPDWLNNQSFRDQAAYEALAAHDAEQAQAAKAVPAVRVADVGFRWDGEKQQHVPTLLVEFEPVPANSGSDAKGWRDRDAMAAMLAAAAPAPQAQAAGQEPPPLPEPDGTVEIDCGPAPGGGREIVFKDGYSADQMHAYARAALAARPAVPAGFVLVPVEVLEDAATAIGHFVSDHGWSDEDMQAMDNLDAYIARHKANAAPATPGPAPDCED